MKLTKAKAMGQFQALGPAAHGEVHKIGKLRRLAKFMKDTTKYFHKQHTGHNKRESNEIATFEQPQIENYLAAITNLTEPRRDPQVCQHSIDHPATVDIRTRASATTESHGYINNASGNPSIECCVATASIYDSGIHSPVELQLSKSSVSGRALCENSIASVQGNAELSHRMLKGYAAPDTSVAGTGHSRQVSTSSTLHVSLRSHTSEPFLRDKCLGPCQPRQDFKAIENLLLGFKELQSEKTWSFLLASRETSHKNEMDTLVESHTDEVKYLEADLEKANKRKDYFEARIKKEVLQKLTAKDALKTLQEQYSADSTQHEARIRELTERNLEMVTIVSDMAANEATYKEELTAKANELDQLRCHLREVLVKVKEEKDHSQIKIQNLQYALDGTPMAEDVDIKGHLELKKQQVQNLLDQVVELSNELERVESEAARQQLKADRVVEQCMQDTKHSQTVEAHLRSLLEISDKQKNNYLFLLRSDSSTPVDARLQAADKVLKAFGKEMNILVTAKVKADVALAAAENGRLALEFLHRDLRAELTKKEEEFEDLEHKIEGLNGDKDYLDAELSIVTEEKNREVQCSGQTIADYQDVVQALQQYIDNLGGMGADAMTAWVWNAKVAEVEHLKESLKQAQFVILEHEERRYERQGIESLDACLASNYDQVTAQQAEQLNIATEESARLRLVIRELIEAQEAHNCEESLQEGSCDALQQQSGGEGVCQKVFMEGHSLLEAPPASDQVVGKCGIDNGDEVEDFFHAAAENLRKDSSLLNPVAGSKAEMQRLWGTMVAPILTDKKAVEGVHTGRRIIRRVRRQENLFAIYQKTAAKGKDKADERPTGCIDEQHIPQDNDMIPPIYDVIPYQGVSIMYEDLRNICDAGQGL